MRSILGASLLLHRFASALCEVIEPSIAIVDLSKEDDKLLSLGKIQPEDILQKSETSDVIFVPEPTALTNDQAKKPPGQWTDEQKLTLETFKEIVATDLENVWVVAYIDPRCRDCLILSIEWERLTQIEETEKRKIKLGYVDISVEENWKIIQDHTKGKKLTHTPAITLYGDNKESPFWYTKEDTPTADGVHTWVSSYADHFGYGYWDPDLYEGASVHPKSYPYGYGGHYYDGPYHEGALRAAGVAVGPYGKGYTTSGKY